MRKFPKIRYPSDPETDGLHNGEVVVTEKIDGANFRFTWDDEDGLVIGTRNHTYTTDDENLPHAFTHAVEYVQNALEQASNQFLAAFQAGEWTLFGEAMHRHSLVYEDIDYHNPSKGAPHAPVEGETPNVVLFDIWVEDEGEWLPWDEFENVVSSSPFETTEVLERGDPDELSFDVPEESMFGGPPEGIVARRVDGTVRAKKVTEDFKETNAVAFENPSKAQSDAAEFVAAYITRERIENVAHGLVDEGLYEQLEMPMMEDLPREVLKDAMAENGWDLLTSGGFEGEWDDDFKGEVRSKASKKCARVLKEELQSF
jgi:hypothetical protein